MHGLSHHDALPQVNLLFPRVHSVHWLGTYTKWSLVPQEMWQLFRIIFFSNKYLCWINFENLSIEKNIDEILVFDDIFQKNCLYCCGPLFSVHDDVNKWKHFPCYWPSVSGNHWSLVDSHHKHQWCRALMFSLMYAWKNGSANNWDASDLRHCGVLFRGLEIFKK